MIHFTTLNRHLRTPCPRSRLFVLTLATVGLFVWPVVTRAATDKIIGTFNTDGTAQDVIVVGNYAYVADGSNGVAVVNISNPAAPTLAYTYDTPGTATQVNVSGSVLYVADTTAVQILSLGNPAAPAFLGAYAATGLTVTNVVADGTHLYVLGALTGTTVLEVLNVANAGSPVKTGSLAVNGGTAIALSGNYVYTAGGTKLDIVDISAYPTLTLAGTYTDPNAAAVYRGVQVYGSIAYINDAALGMHGVAIATPAAPTPTFESATQFPSTPFGAGIAISNGYVFLTQTAAGGLAIYDITSTGSPVYVDTYSGSAPANAVTIANDVAYVAAGSAGLQLINVAHPDAIPPAVTPIGDLAPVVAPGGKYTDPGVTVTDNVGGTGTEVSGTVDTSKVGEYLLTYIVTDRAGNTTTVKRRVIVGPSIEKLKLKNNTYTLPVGKKRLILKPFAGYRGAVLGRKLIVDTKKNPFYVFIATGAIRQPKFVMYNASGKLVTRQNLIAISVNGLQVAIVPNPSTLSIFFTIAPKTNGLTATIFNVSKSGFKSLKRVTVTPGTGTLVMKWLKGYTNEYALVTLVKGKTATPYVWRYNGSKKSFVRDKKFDTTRLSWTKTSIRLK